MTPPRLLGVDPSLTCTGWASDAGHGTIRTRPDTPLEQRMLTITWQIIDAADDIAADLVLIEAPVSHGASNTLVQLGGLAWVIRCALTTAGITWVSIGNSQRTKWATGRGNAKKIEVLIAAREKLGFDGTADDIADAKWLHHMGTAAYGPPDADLPAYRSEVLSAVAWPEINGHTPAWPTPAKPTRKKAS